MSLSVSTSFHEESFSAGTEMHGESDSRAEPSACRDVEVAIPAHLHRFGTTTRARVSGKRNGPVIVALGGISGNRFVCTTADGLSGWWPGLIGPGCAINPARHCIVGLDFGADATGAAAPLAMTVCATGELAKADGLIAPAGNLGRSRDFLSASLRSLRPPKRRNKGTPT